MPQPDGPESLAHQDGGVRRHRVLRRDGGGVRAGSREHPLHLEGGAGPEAPLREGRDLGAQAHPGAAARATTRSGSAIIRRADPEVLDLVLGPPGVGHALLRPRHLTDVGVGPGVVAADPTLGAWSRRHTERLPGWSTTTATAS